MLPAAVALVTIPALIHGLGVDRFGVLTLVWMVIGYFSLFDLGLGRALTQVVSERLGQGDEQGIPVVVWTALTVMTALGIVAGGIIAVIAPLLVHSLLKIPPALQNETRNAMYLLAGTIPFVLLIAGLAGILSALQRFAV